MLRTQIYLDPGQKRDLSQISRRRRATVSELIRQAIEEFLQKSSSGFEEAVEKSFGLWSKRKDIGNASVYVRKIRREWEKREKRILSLPLRPREPERSWLPSTKSIIP